MSSPKKILFVSYPAGAGHKRAAEALRLTCAEKYPQVTALHIDLADYSDWLIKKSVVSGFHFLAKHLPKAYGLLYDGTDSAAVAKLLNYFSSLLKINTRKLHQLVENFAPDRIVCTHFFATPLLRSFTKKIPTDMLITDYELNRIVLDPQVRYFFAPNEATAAEVIQQKREAFPTGIPLHPEFYKQKDTAQISAAFGLSPARPTILVLSGGTGLLDSSQIIKQILNAISGINLVVISGKNNRPLFKKLNRLQAGQNSRYIVLEYSEKIDELMRIADVIISKPGGLTVTECLHLKKPLLMVRPIPGQEEANARFVEKNNYGRLITDENKIADAVNEILRRPDIFTAAEMPASPNEKIIEAALS